MGVEPMDRFDRCVLLAFVLNVVDVLITIVLTCHMGLIEANPAMDALISRSPVAFTVTKLVVVGSVCLYLKKRRGEHSEMTAFTTGVVVGMLLMICCWQTWMLLWALSVI
jgi:hypothetical protein